MGRRSGLQKGLKMENTWKYKIELRDVQVFDEIAEQRKTTFPEDLKQFILEHNAATPERYNFMVGVNERVFGAVLSFNHEDEDADTVSPALTAIKGPELIPFGIDPFGNYICYKTTNGYVVFWDHESGEYQSTGLSLAEFIDSLY